MPEFLSDDWIAALDAHSIAVETSAALDGLTLIVQQVVRLPDGGDVRYHLTIADGRVRVAAGDAPRADITLTSDYETARALQSGALNAQHALATGRLRLGGDLNQLLGRADALAAIGDVFVRVREATTYDA